MVGALSVSCIGLGVVGIDGGFDWLLIELAT